MSSIYRHSRLLLVYCVVLAAFEEQLSLYKHEMPTTEDFEGVIDAILRLQDTYEISSGQFVDGSFSKASNSPRMTG